MATPRTHATPDTRDLFWSRVAGSINLCASCVCSRVNRPPLRFSRWTYLPPVCVELDEPRAFRDLRGGESSQHARAKCVPRCYSQASTKPPKHKAHHEHVWTASSSTGSDFHYLCVPSSNLAAYLCVWRNICRNFCSRSGAGYHREMVYFGNYHARKQRNGRRLLTPPRTDRVVLNPVPALCIHVNFVYAQAREKPSAATAADTFEGGFGCHVHVLHISRLNASSRSNSSVLEPRLLRHVDGQRKACTPQ